MVRRRRIPPAAASLLAAASLQAGEAPAVHRPRLASPEVVAPFLQDVKPGHDAFTEERDVEELHARLRALAARMKAGPGAALGDLLAPGFHGGRLRLARTVPAAREGPFDVRRGRAMPDLRTAGFAGMVPSEPTLDAAAFTAEWRRLVGGLRQVLVAEFLITRITLDREKARAVTR